MTTTSLRLDFLKVLTDRLQEISVANGYSVDLVPNGIIRGRVKLGAGDPVPCITIFEPPVVPGTESMSPAFGAHVRTPWNVIVQGFIKEGNPHPCDPAYLFMEDVRRVISVNSGLQSSGAVRSPNPFGLGEFVEKIKIGSPIVRPPDNISVFAYFWLNLTLEIVEDLR